MGKLKELVARDSGDLSSLEKQVEQNDATFGAGAVIQLASLVLKSQLNHSPCPKCYISLLHLFFKAGQISTNPGHQLLQPAHPWEGGLQLLRHLLGLAPPLSKALQLASSFSHHL